MSEANLSMLQELQQLKEFKKETLQWQKDMSENMDQNFLLIMGIIIYLMQGGFALLEAGSVRSKNTTNILIKNLLDSFISGLFYWLLGYAFAYGTGNAFIGYDLFAHAGFEDTEYAAWFFQYVFAATAATIVSGAVAERCDFVAYIVYSSFITGFIYPVLTHWAWSGEGWLAKGFEYKNGNETFQISYQDFAGSGIVHVTGGVAAFVGAAVMGARIGRFDKETGRPQEIKGHSVPLAALGGFILIFGFFAFNGSSQGSISSSGDGLAVATAVKNTVMSATSGAFTTLIMNRVRWFGDKTWSFNTTLNGALAGMVAICGGCNVLETYMAFIVGIGGGLAYMITTWLVLFKFKVDDPLDACAVHYGGGVWGVISVALFAKDTGVVYNINAQSGLFLAWQLVGLASVIAWTGVLCFIMFFILKKVNYLRVPFDYEYKGLDIPKHGEDAYPAEAYGHGWGERGDSVHGMVSKIKSNMSIVSSNGKPTELSKTNGHTDSGLSLDKDPIQNSTVDTTQLSHL